MRKSTILMMGLISILLLGQQSWRSKKPRILKSVPENRAVDVDPNLQEIIIVFSSPVELTIDSFRETDEGEFPLITANPFYLDPVTYVLPVRLRPQTAYSLSIHPHSRTKLTSVMDSKEPKFQKLSFTTRTVLKRIIFAAGRSEI